MNSIGRQLMQESKADINELKISWTKRDLLSLLLRANVAPDLLPNQRMSDADVLSRESHHLPAYHRWTHWLYAIRNSYVHGRWTRNDKVCSDLEFRPCNGPLLIYLKWNSTATSWALFALTQNPDAQRKLREELLRAGTDNPTMDELNALPYLDAVIREVLRVHAPVSGTEREAVKDDFLPFSEPLIDKYGNVINGIQ